MEAAAAVARKLREMGAPMLEVIPQSSFPVIHEVGKVGIFVLLTLKIG